MRITVATLRTDPIEAHQRYGPPEGGFFEIEVNMNRTAIGLSRDPWGLVKREIATHLAQAILDTGVPKEYWTAEFHSEIAKEFNLPQRTRMGI